MDGAGRTDGLALAAELAEIVIDICHIAFNGDCALRTGLGADSAAYAGGGAGLPGGRALVLVHAADVDTHAARSLGTKLYDVLRAGLHTGTASCTLLLIHHRQAGGRIHGESSELAGGDTVSTSETAVGAAGIPAVKGGLHLAGRSAIIGVDKRPVGARTIAPDDCEHRSLLLELIAEDSGHFLHHLIASDRTEMPVKIRRFYSSIREGTTSGKAAAAAIGARHHLFNLVNARIFLNLELLRHEEKHHGKQKSQTGKNHDCPDNCTSHCFFFISKVYSFLSLSRSSHSTRYHSPTAAIPHRPACSSPRPAELSASSTATMRTRGST